MEKIKALNSLHKFSHLKHPGKITVEYIWGGARSCVDLRSKVQTFKADKVSTVEDLPIWHYDGSSTNQAAGDNSEITIIPRQIYKDPFTGDDNLLVLCDTWTPDGKPAKGNYRPIANELMEKIKDQEPWFGLEQEYTLMDPNALPEWPMGWPRNGYPGPQGPYYCGVGAGNAIARKLIEDHLRVSLYCGLQLGGTNAEVMPGSWEFQVGPCVGIEAGDDMTMARYLLMRVAECYGIGVSFEPKPIEGDWNGSGCHTNFSTKEMREEGGYKHIMRAMDCLARDHKHHIQVYGPKNEARLTGRHETADINTFKWGVADRGASIRINNSTHDKQKGFFEDRRPAANMNPYIVTASLVDSIYNEGQNLAELVKEYEDFLSTAVDA